MAVLLMALPSCGLLPAQHYALSRLPLPPDKGWVQLPAARWLVNTGIEPGLLVFCRDGECGEQTFIATLLLTGQEAAYADLLMRDPVKALMLARPTDPAVGQARRTARRHAARVASADVTPIAHRGWSGGLVRLATRNSTGRAAHVALVARRQGTRADLVMAVAASPEVARQRLLLALD